MIYKFTAKWCSSCLITNQNFVKLVAEYKAQNTEITYQEIDVDSNQKQDLELMKKLGINEDSVLPIIIFTDKNDMEISRSIGEKDRSQLITIIDKDLLENQNKVSPSSLFNQPKSGFLSNLKNIFK